MVFCSLQLEAHKQWAHQGSLFKIVEQEPADARHVAIILLDEQSTSAKTKGSIEGRPDIPFINRYLLQGVSVFQENFIEQTGLLSSCKKEGRKLSGAPRGAILEHQIFATGTSSGYFLACARRVLYFDLCMISSPCCSYQAVPISSAQRLLPVNMLHADQPCLDSCETVLNAPSLTGTSCCMCRCCVHH